MSVPQRLLLALIVFAAGACTEDSGGDRVGTATTTPSSDTTTLSTTVPEISTTQPAGADERIDSETVQVFFPVDVGGADCTEVEAVERTVSDASVSAALAALFGGPTDQAGALGGLFGPATAGLLTGVTVDDGTAYVDLAPAFTDLNNISTACLGASFISAVEATATQFPEVEDVTFAVAGDPSTFYDIMQIGCPEPAEPGNRCDPSPFQA